MKLCNGGGADVSGNDESDTHRYANHVCNGWPGTRTGDGDGEGDDDEVEEVRLRLWDLRPMKSGEVLLVVDSW